MGLSCAPVMHGREAMGVWRSGVPMMPEQPGGFTVETGESQTIRPWNVVVTAKDHEQRHLARLVKRLGDF